MMIKHVEQINVTQEKNTAPPVANIQRWEQHKPELANSLQKLSFVWI
jgi:hypothetical protein